MACRPIAFDAIPRSAPDRLLAAAAGATPFARWTVHRAWWDAYGATAHKPTEGARSRRFVGRLAELEATEPDGGQLRLAQVRVAERLIFAALVFEAGDTSFLYNAAMDPTARELSPGIVGTAGYIREALAIRRFDFLRGAEPYEYEWGARNQVVKRLLVVRR